MADRAAGLWQNARNEAAISLKILQLLVSRLFVEVKIQPQRDPGLSPGTLKTGPQKNARSIFLREKNWQCRVWLAARSRRYCGTPREECRPPQTMPRTVPTPCLDTHVHPGHAQCQTRMNTELDTSGYVWLSYTRIDS
jgi:hypothetical protein